MKHLKLYNYFRSSASYRARIALAYKKIPYESVQIHLLKDGGEQHKAEYKVLNPLGHVPCLTHLIDGELRVITQSVAIIEYLDEMFPEIPLFPKEPYKKALVRQFIEIINSFAQPMGNLSTLGHLEEMHQYDLAKKEAWVQYWNEKALSALEELHRKHGMDYCVGNEITAAEIFLVPHLLTARRYKCGLESYPNLLAVEAKCLVLDSFQPMLEEQS